MENYRTIITFVLIVGGLLLGGLTNNASAQDEIDIKKTDQFLQSKFKKSNIPGFAVAIVNHKEILFSKGYGKTGNQQAVTGNTPFAIASLSKAFTALAVMQLVESGKIHLDSAVAHYIPSFPLKEDKITVRQLLNQTSGLSDRVFPEMKFNQQPTNLENSIKRLETVKLSDKPNEQFNYHNPNYQILARLVEVVTDEEFSNYLYKNVLVKMQMDHTSNFSSTKDFYSINHLSQGYTFFFGYPLKMKEPDWFVQGSAGIISTVNDMAKFLIMNLNKGNFEGKQLLSMEGIKAMQTPPQAISGPYHYGMGWFADEKGNLNHQGILWTYQAGETILTEQGYGIVVLFNSGFNVFQIQNYSSFIQGISKIVNNQNPGVPVVPIIMYDAFVGILVLIAIFFGIRRLNRLSYWLEKYNHRPKIQSWPRLLMRLIPLFILITMPQILTLISDRVFSWERIFWTMPGIIIWLAIVSIFNLTIVFTRLKIIYCKQYFKSGKL